MLQSIEGSHDMKTPERTGAPALGNAIGLFLALWAIDQYDWIDTSQREFVVAACGTICIHILMEARNLFSWVSSKLDEKKTEQ